MSTDSRDQTLERVDALAKQIGETIRVAAKDDLSALARLHGWCLEIADAGTSRPPDESGRWVDQAKSTADALESLILGDGVDAESCFRDIVAKLDELEALISSTLAGGEGSGPETSSTAAGESEMADSPPTGNAPVPHRSRQSTRSAYVPEPLRIGEGEFEFVREFLDEAAEHIQAIEAAVLEVEAFPGDTDRINDLFRPFHTIKGMAGFLNLRDINCLAHEAETLLDQGRKGNRLVTPALIDLIFEVVDVLKSQLAAIRGWVAEPSGEPVPQPPVAQMIDRLRAVVAGEVDPGGAQTVPSDTLGRPDICPGGTDTEVRLSASPAMDHNQQELDSPPPPVSSKAPDSRPEVQKELGHPAGTPGESRSASRSPQSASAGDPVAKAATEQSIRIDTAKLDALVDMVGELCIAQTLVSASPRLGEDFKLNKDVTQVSKIVRSVQEVAMSMRMIPIGPTFQKMTRLVRDLSRKANKKVTLSFSGEDTELDKNVIQQIGDPLVHMVRNAVDHGIEAPEERVAAGKPETGSVHLNARHQGGNIIIEIGDDGRGLDAEALVAKGIEKGLVQPDQELGEQEAFHLIFAPGFSTASRVTDISGRGVGMDVVRRNIEELRGKTEIRSEKGKGSTFVLRLPLTLAIIDGMVVRVGGERFIIPTISIEQSLRPSREHISTVQRRGAVLDVRGKLVPLIQLGNLFDFAPSIEPHEAMVIVAQADDKPIGIVVEELLGQQQVVIKSLGDQFQGLHGISGAGILGDGRVGLILDPAGLAHEYRHHGGACLGSARLDRTDSDVKSIDAGKAETQIGGGTGSRENAAQCVAV